MQEKTQHLTDVIRNRSSWLYGFVVLLVSTVFIVFLLLSDKQAVINQELMFNQQQALQTFLAKQAVDDHLNRHYNEAYILASTGVMDYVSGDEETVSLDNMFQTIQAISPEITVIGYFETPQHEVLVRSSELHKEDTVGDKEIALQLSRQWVEDYWIDAFEKAPQPYVPPFYITEEHQLFGILTPVSLRGEEQGMLVLILDFNHMINQYIAPMRSGEFGTAFLMDGNGVMIYNVDHAIIGRSIFDGMIVNNDELLQFAKRMVTEPSGMGDFPSVDEHGQGYRRLTAWTTAELGDQHLIIGMFAPDFEINPMMVQSRFQRLVMAIVLVFILVMLSVAFFRYRQSLIESTAVQLQNVVETRTDELRRANASLQEEITERMRIEQELRQNEERLDLVIRSSNDGIFDANLLTGEVYVSPRYYTMLGYVEGDLELENDTLIDLIHPEDRDEVISIENDYISHGQSNLELNFRMKKKDGSYAWILSRGSIVEWDEKGNAKRYLGTHADITELKRIQEALEVSEERYRLLFESSLDGFVMARIDGTILTCNRAYMEMVGYGLEELRQMTFYDLTPDQYVKWQKQFMDEEVIPKGYSGIYEKEYRRKDGSIFPIEVRAYLQKDAVGNPIGVWAFVRDISERKKTEQELLDYRQHLEDLVQQRTKELEEINATLEEEISERRQVENNLRLSENRFRSIAEALRSSEKRLRAIFNNAAVGIIVQDNQGYILQNNNLYSEMMRASAEELVGLGYQQITHPEDYNIGKEEKGRMELGEIDLFRIEKRYVRRDGTFFWADLSITPIRNEENQIEATIGVVVDITDLKQSQEKLHLAKEAAEAANRAKSLFLANMSHELRTPLNAILGFSQIMARDPQLTVAQKESLQTISRSGDHLLALINDILEFSKIEAGRITIQNQAFDLFRLLTDLESMFSLRVKEKGISLVFFRTDDVPQYVMMDEGKLRQILMNLMSNAVKFTDQGEITVHVSSEGNRLQSMDGKPTLYFEVSDTGSGIAEDELELIFDAFVQAQSSNPSTEGTGLGLPISRQFVQAMGGDLTASSHQGKGSVFRFFVNYQIKEAEDVPGEKRSKRALAIAEGEPEYRIMITDDHKESRELLALMLSSLGFQVREAVNGQEAVEIWSEWQPHLIWMDMRMPVMDGFEATRRIKADEREKNTIIIALTASAFEEDREVMLAEGCDDFVRKPYREEEIIDRIVSFLGVKFIYEQADSDQDFLSRQEKGFQNAALLLTAEDLAELPREWQYQLSRATVVLDAAEIVKICDQMRKEGYAQQADGLAALANNFSYKRILSLLEEAGKET